MKTCSICNDDKEESQFHKTKTGLFPWCKECRKEKDKSYHQGRDLTIKYQQVKIRSEANKKALVEYLLTHPCESCGEADPVVLEFHHIQDKKENVSNMIQSYSWDTISKEIAKCKVLCANCHRRVTAKEQNFFKLNRGIAQLIEC